MKNYYALGLVICWHASALGTVQDIAKKTKDELTKCSNIKIELAEVSQKALEETTNQFKTRTNCLCAKVPMDLLKDAKKLLETYDSIRQKQAAVNKTVVTDLTTFKEIQSFVQELSPDDKLEQTLKKLVDIMTPTPIDITPEKLKMLATSIKIMAKIAINSIEQARDLSNLPQGDVNLPNLINPLIETSYTYINNMVTEIQKNTYYQSDSLGEIQKQLAGKTSLDAKRKAIKSVSNL